MYAENKINLREREREREGKGELDFVSKCPIRGVSKMFCPDLSFPKIPDPNISKQSVNDIRHTMNMK